MRFKPYVEFANFTCRFGDHLVLVNLLEDVVLPAMLDVQQRRVVGDTTYFLRDVGITRLGEGEDERVCVYGRFVKDTKYERTHVVEDGNVKRSDASMPAALMSMYILILESHKLVFLHENRDAPGIESFRNTIEHFLKNKHEAFIRRLQESLEATEGDKQKVYDALRARSLIAEGTKVDPNEDEDRAERTGESPEDARAAEEPRRRRKFKADTLSNLRRLIPRPILDVVPIGSESSLEEFLNSFALLSEVKITLINTNDEQDNDDFFTQVRRKKASIGADQTTLDHKNREGLNKGEALSQVRAVALQGNARLRLEGKDDQGRDKSGSEDKFKVRVTVPDLPEEDDVAARLPSLWGAFKDAVVEGTIKLQPVPSATSDKINELNFDEFEFDPSRMQLGDHDGD